MSSLQVRLGALITAIGADIKALYTATAANTPSITTTTSSATPAPVGSAKVNRFSVTALAVNATIAAPSGTPSDGNSLVIRIKDAGAAKTLAYNSIFRAVGVILPTTTVVSKNTYLGCVYNGPDSKWDVIAVGQEA